MSVTQITERKNLYRKICGLPDNAVGQVMKFIDRIAVSDTEEHMKYCVSIHGNERDGYRGECPDLPGCFSQGDTPDELMENMKEAISVYIPPASEMLKYEEAFPGLLNRIMSMAEQQSTHRQEIEKIIIRANARNSTLGVVFIFVLALSTLILGAFCIYWNKDVLGTTIGGIGLVSIVGIFIYLWNAFEPRGERSKSKAETRLTATPKEEANT